MAILRGREVQIIGPVDSGRPISITVEGKDGQRENVYLTELQVTKEEKKTVEDMAIDDYSGIKIIEDKDLNNLRDGQDADKIEAVQAKDQAKAEKAKK